ncbi:hypothetical protein ACFXMF_35670, partial [Embleya sp. NPDC059213]|uniref:hypothetical protein n=1 Tax=Embleya sp. NPDC059213 TaxID=3346771 RepID=UPI0036835451
GEVEAALRSIEQVCDAVVVVRRGGAGDARLVGYPTGPVDPARSGSRPGMESTKPAKSRSLATAATANTRPIRQAEPRYM